MGARTIAVLGGGVTGLVAAHALRQRLKAASVTVYEGSQRFGGWISTTRDGPTKALCEAGPHSLRASGVAAETTMRLAYDLNVHERVVAAQAHPGVTNRFVFMDGRLVKVPSNLRSLFALSNPIVKALWYGIMRDLFTPRDRTRDEQEETVHAFVSRRLGVPFADMVVDPVMRGIFAGDARELSLAAVHAQMDEARRESGSIVRHALRRSSPKTKDDGAAASDDRADVLGWDIVKRELDEARDAGDARRMARVTMMNLERAAFVSVLKRAMVWSFEDGMGTLVEALRMNLEAMDVPLRTGMEVTAIRPRPDGGGGGEIFFSDGTSVRADAIVCALPAHSLARCFASGKSDLERDLSGTLGDIKAVSVGVVNLAYANQVLPHVGFGYLVPSWVKSDALGVIWDSCVFKQQEVEGGPASRLTVMMGGHQFRELFGDPRAVTASRLVAVAKETLRNQMGISEEPIHADARVCIDCIAQYTLGHTARVKRIRELSRGLFGDGAVEIVGASFDGVGVNDCVHNATLAAVRIAKHLSATTTQPPNLQHT